MIFSEKFIEKVRESTDIVEIIGQNVTLKRAGANYKGVCPFHQEKTPSFIVSPDKQIFHCFGCGKGGDVIKYIMEYEHFEFIDVVKMLAEKAHIPLEYEESEYDRKQRSDRERFYQINLDAARFFMNHFYKSDKAKNYAVKRNITPESVKNYGLGYAPDSWNLLYDEMIKMGHSEEDLIALGLVVKRKNKTGCYDKFRNRLIFPIIDLKRRVIGFGGRTISDEKPKYLNSSDSIIFYKGKELYGLYKAKEKTRHNPMIIVEGYMDVVALASKGYENVVASLGTAFTSDQAKLVKRYSEESILCYDSDSAGRKATLRAFDVFKQIGADSKALWYTSAKDPDELLKKSGKKVFDELVKKPLSYIEYYVYYLKTIYNLDRPDQKIMYLKQVLKFLKNKVEPLEREAYIEWIAQETNISKTTLLDKLDDKKTSSKKVYFDNNKIKAPRTNKISILDIELSFIELILLYKDKDELLEDCILNVKWSNEKLKDICLGIYNNKDKDRFLLMLKDYENNNRIEIPKQKEELQVVMYDCAYKLLDKNINDLKECAKNDNQDGIMILRIENLARDIKKKNQNTKNEHNKKLSNIQQKKEQVKLKIEHLKQLDVLIRTFGRSDLLGCETREE